MFTAANIEVIRTPPQAPLANAYAERSPNPPTAGNQPAATKTQRRQILGGLINEYAQAA